MYLRPAAFLASRQRHFPQFKYLASVIQYQWEGSTSLLHPEQKLGGDVIRSGPIEREGSDTAPGGHHLVVETLVCDSFDR